MTGVREDRDPFADSPGRNEPYATVEVDPEKVGVVHPVYAPNHDGDPDPGEVVWTWVPYEEHDGRGKDRPVLLVAREKAGTLLAIKLTSKRHDDMDTWVDIGTGPWDREARESWAVIDRVVRVYHEGMRREACALGRDRFDQVVAHLRSRYHWT
jgi:PemK-like, MazF-like toxin of type II toxin-antitoxin system